MCFNKYTAIMTERYPDRIKDLLAYSSLIVKASKEFKGAHWLEYNTRFRKQAAVDHT